MKTLEELAAIRAKMLEQVSLRKDDCIDTRVVVAWQPAALPPVRVRSC